LAGKRPSIAQKVVAPSKRDQVRAALTGTKIPIGRAGELRIVFCDHGVPVGEMVAVPFSVRFEPDTLVTYATWYVSDSLGNPVEVKGAYHYCIRAFKAELPMDLMGHLYSGQIYAFLPTERVKILKGLKRYQEIEPWLPERRDTPLLRSLLGLKASKERKFSSLERYSRAFTS
jgi:hypothetical protein